MSAHDHPRLGSHTAGRRPAAETSAAGPRAATELVWGKGDWIVENSWDPPPPVTTISWHLMHGYDCLNVYVGRGGLHIALQDWNEIEIPARLVGHRLRPPRGQPSLCRDRRAADAVSRVGVADALVDDQRPQHGADDRHRDHGVDLTGQRDHRQQHHGRDESLGAE